VFNYTELADAAKAKQEANRLATERHRQLRADPCVFFARVRAHLQEEMRKVNVELRKKKAALFDQNHLPGFPNEMFVTYGTDTLCRVGLGIMEGGCRVTAIISGPPNGYEISRKAYLCDQPAACREARPEGGRAVPCRPDEIAQDIIAAVLFGRFG
jgi:hypothetical protein